MKLNIKDLEKHNIFGTLVYLDGKNITNICIESNDEENYVIVYRKNNDKYEFDKYGNIIKEKLFGNVEIKLKINENNKEEFKVDPKINTIVHNGKFYTQI